MNWIGDACADNILESYSSAEKSHFSVIMLFCYRQSDIFPFAH